MKLFISGGGKRPFVLDELFVKALIKGKPLLYIPLAMEKKLFPVCYKWFSGYFSSLGVNDFEMAESFEDVDLERYSGVYIGGGNTPKLLKEMKESSFYEKLEKAIDEGMPVAGGSAGAVIHGKTIIPSLIADENKVGLKDFNAYDNLKGFEVWCHYTKEDDEDIREYIEKYNFEKVIAISDYVGIYVSGEEMKIVGESSAWIFDSKGKREVKSGEVISS